MRAPLPALELADGTVLTFFFRGRGAPPFTHSALSDIWFTDIDLSLFDDKIRFYVTVEDDSFQFINSCYSSTKYDSPAINAISKALYSCKIDPIYNRVEFIAQKAALADQASLRILVDVLNPNKAISDKYIDVRLMKQFSSNIIGYGKCSNIMNVNPIYINYHQLLLAWDLRVDPNLPMPLKVVRGDSDYPRHMPFNSFKVVFQLVDDTPDNVELKIDIGIGGQMGSLILEGSISENLPGQANKIVQCLERYKGQPTLRRISCYGVGKLIAGQTYFVSFKM